MSDFERTDYGIKYGKTEIQCCWSDDKSAALTIKSPKTDCEITIYLTPSGGVEIRDRLEKVSLIKITKPRRKNKK